MNTSTQRHERIMSVIEKRRTDISCTSSGIPIPTISWTINNMPTRFEQTDTSTDFRATAYSVQDVRITPASTVSRLHIDNPYPTDEGIYVCIGTSYFEGLAFTSINFTIVVVYGTLKQKCKYIRIILVYTQSRQ